MFNEAQDVLLGLPEALRGQWKTYLTTMAYMQRFRSVLAEDMSKEQWRFWVILT